MLPPAHSMPSSNFQLRPRTVEIGAYRGLEFVIEQSIHHGVRICTRCIPRSVIPVYVRSRHSHGAAEPYAPMLMMSLSTHIPSQTYPFQPAPGRCWAPFSTVFIAQRLAGGFDRPLAFANREKRTRRAYSEFIALRLLHMPSHRMVGRGPTCSARRWTSTQKPLREAWTSCHRVNWASGGAARTD